MRISLSKIASEIAKALSLKHYNKDAYRIITEDGFHMMVGLCAEPNPYTSLEFSVHYYIQGLYIPYPRINLSLGDRIGEWEKKDLSVALPIVRSCYEHLPCDSISTILDNVNSYELPYWGGKINRYELLSCSYLVINKEKEARDYLNRIIAFENDENVHWYEDQIKRAKTLLELMDQGNRDKIRELLLSWQKYTMTELKLPEQ